MIEIDAIDYIVLRTTNQQRRWLSIRMSVYTQESELNIIPTNVLQLEVFFAF